MTASTPESAALSAIVAEARKLAADQKTDLVSSFVRGFFARAPEEELLSRAPKNWAAIALDSLKFAQVRPANTPTIRICNPQEAEHGYTSSRTVIQVVNDDMPFLVDSITMALNRGEISLHTLIHPVIAISRNEKRQLSAVDEGPLESFMYIEIERQVTADFEALETALHAVFADVRSSVQDWNAMREKMVDIAEDMAKRPLPVDQAEREEATEFLKWASDNHFTYLGYREYRVVEQKGVKVLVADENTGLGLMRNAPSHGARPISTLAAHQLRRAGNQDVVILTKTNARSTVHRTGHMDYLGIMQYDNDGNAVAEQRFLGLFTSGAYNRRPWDIPLLRRRYEYVMETSGLPSSSHSGKALRHIIETLPRDELFQSSAEELYRTAMGILALQERVRTRLFLRHDRYGRFYSALVYIPRDRFNTDVRVKVETLLRESLDAERFDTSIQIGTSPLAQMHVVVRPKSDSDSSVDADKLEAKVIEIVRDWHDELRESLVAKLGESKGLKLAQKFGRALPVGYVESVTPELAADDVIQASMLEGDRDIGLDFYRLPIDKSLHFKTFHRGGMIALSDALPMLEHLGLRILAEHPYQIKVDDECIAIQDFEVVPGNEVKNLDAVREKFEQAFANIWRGNAENDGFNKLVLGAGLNWRQVAMLRGYAKYLMQAGVTFSQNYMEETLLRYPLVARLLVELFESRFDPARGEDCDRERADTVCSGLRCVLKDHGLEQFDTIAEEVGNACTQDRAAQEDACEDALAIVLEHVSSLDEDRILRGFMAVIQATLRTNFFQAYDGEYRDYISYKFDPEKIVDLLPKPRPYREIFVYSPWVEGVHLRFGPVARGGLRWSDRREDFRTEVLGLVKAQMVKNTVIVPVGAKGGFFVKRSPVGGDRDAVLAEGIACYKRFISALLEITDNLVDGAVVPPRDVVRHDQDDPYLVVAADKGTATFSDIANGLAIERNYWLGDAFASGGSVGYDHKGMGITARGAWESVKRHFRAINIDCQSQDFTCVGIGDMSGDVFGNGMLLSKHIRLLAAFDHRHIFLDPNPDSAASFAERDRLFKLPRSSWEDYKKELISKGGGIFARSLKSIPLTNEVKSALGISAEVEQMSPMQLMNAILKAPVDLFWNGGIGTYVKASSESHADAGDRANNGLRVDGGELRCRIVGEGGNLGLTQRGRIEAAQHGVMLNTDFIDNSAGVDTSDHEVNIKILLNTVMQRGALKVDQRNVLLAEMTEEVGELVLNDNYRQNAAISLMERMSAPRLGSFQHLIRTLESRGLLDRALEYLPSDADFSDRRARGAGLTRAELSVLLSYDKIVIFNELLASDVPEDPFLSRELVRYFPKKLQDSYAADMEHHRLKREIIATAVTNSMVNRMGATFMLRMQEDTGASPAQVAKAYTISREILDARVWWASIDALDFTVPESAQSRAHEAIWALLRSFTRWLLNKPGESLQIAQMVERYGPAMSSLRGRISEFLPNESRADYLDGVKSWENQGFPIDLAREFAAIPYLGYVLDMVDVSDERKLALDDVASVYFELTDVLHIKWLLDQIELLPVEGRWHAHARGVMRDDLHAQQRALVANVLSASTKKNKAKNAVREWLSRDDATLRYTLSMFSDMRNLRAMDYATLSVAVRRLAQIATAGAHALGR